MIPIRSSLVSEGILRSIAQAHRRIWVTCSFGRRAWANFAPLLGNSNRYGTLNKLQHALIFCQMREQWAQKINWIPLCFVFLRKPIANWVALARLMVLGAIGSKWFTSCPPESIGLRRRAVRLSRPILPAIFYFLYRTAVLSSSPMQTQAALIGTKVNDSAWAKGGLLSSSLHHPSMCLRCSSPRYQGTAKYVAVGFVLWFFD
jgi:hypothetical protein